MIFVHRFRQSVTNRYQSISIYLSIVSENRYQSITTRIFAIDWSSIFNINRLIDIDWYWLISIVIDCVLWWSPDFQCFFLCLYYTLQKWRNIGSLKRRSNRLRVVKKYFKKYFFLIYFKLLSKCLYCATKRTLKEPGFPMGIHQTGGNISSKSSMIHFPVSDPDAGRKIWLTTSTRTARTP